MSRSTSRVASDAEDQMREEGSPYTSASHIHMLRPDQLIIVDFSEWGKVIMVVIDFFSYLGMLRHFFILEDNRDRIKNTTMKVLDRKFKKFKVDLKKKYFKIEDSKEINIDRRPEYISRESWIRMVDYWLSSSGRKIQAIVEQTINERLEMAPTIDRVQVENEVYHELAGPEHHSRVRLYGIGRRPTSSQEARNKLAIDELTKKLEDERREREAERRELEAERRANQARMSEYEAQIKSLNEKWAMFNQLLQQQPRTFGAPPQLVSVYANVSQYANVLEVAPQGGNARDSFSTYREHNEKGKEKVEEEEEEEEE
ncbi:hypothetical protein Cni_G10067 [Canna indica]|uniref:Uncharacterized protein n=1 Tax=Canna indica TaxID=4628 RepID=A0AAQ3Q9J6_9LILI|nr:hypothetical protein Cni_G10067 [Canna indica]